VIRPSGQFLARAMQSRAVSAGKIMRAKNRTFRNAMQSSFARPALLRKYCASVFQNLRRMRAAAHSAV
jgi:hypothetical protein